MNHLLNQKMTECFEYMILFSDKFENFILISVEGIYVLDEKYVCPRKNMHQYSVVSFGCYCRISYTEISWLIFLENVSSGIDPLELGY